MCIVIGHLQFQRDEMVFDLKVIRRSNCNTKTLRPLTLTANINTESVFSALMLAVEIKSF